MINIEKFKRWLTNGGCEILPITNDYEILRFKGRQVGVVYKSGKFGNPYTKNAIIAWKKNKKWDGFPISTGRDKNYKKYKQTLILRDGKNCFYCGLPLEDDITVEHLIPLTMGGQNNLANMVLAHEKCNADVDNMSLNQKINIAIKNRVELIIKR